MQHGHGALGQSMVKQAAETNVIPHFVHPSLIRHRQQPSTVLPAGCSVAMKNGLTVLQINGGTVKQTRELQSSVNWPKNRELKGLWGS